MFLPYDPVILLIGIYLREMKVYVHTKACTQIITEVLFIVAKKMETT